MRFDFSGPPKRPRLAPKRTFTELCEQIGKPVAAVTRYFGHSQEIGIAVPQGLGRRPTYYDPAEFLAWWAEYEAKAQPRQSRMRDIHAALKAESNRLATTLWMPDGKETILEALEGEINRDRNGKVRK